MNEMDNNNLSQPDTNEAPAADSTKSRLKRIAGLAAAFLPALLVMLLIFWLSDQPAVQSSRGKNTIGEFIQNYRFKKHLYIFFI